MELICPHCGRDRLWYDPYTGNFDCPTCGTSALPEELTCPLCGKAGSLRAEDEISLLRQLRRSSVRPLPGGNGPGLLL